MNFEVFIYSGAKCASSTLNATLINFGYNTFHVHNDEFYIANFKELIEETNCRTIKELILKQVCDKVYIFDIYRNPIERMISSLFQNFELYLGKNYLNVDINLLIYFFYKIYNNEEYHPLDDEYPILKDVEFNVKYCQLVDGKFNYFKFRFKDLNKWSEYLSEIFNKEITIFDSNLTSDKEYLDLYRIFKKKFRISSSMLNSYINTPTFKKYNSEEEQLEYYNQWKLRIKNEEYFEELISNCNYINLPENFNCRKYAFNNPDVYEIYKTDNQLKFHYEFYGWRENRFYE